MRHAPEDIPHATNEISAAIIGAAIEVHRALGPGLLESAYEEALVVELERRSHSVRRQVEVDLTYRGELLAAALRLDLVVDATVVVEVKSIAAFAAIHDAQLLTYLTFTGCRVGLLLNFNVPRLVDGVRRLVR